MNRAFIFDLDGVVVNTAKFHYQAWKQLAQSLGFDFPEEKGELLKGVSRMESLEIVLEAGEMTYLKAVEKEVLADSKNRLYLDFISGLSNEDILPGIYEFLLRIRSEGYRTALGSASKSGGLILRRLGIENLFDVIVDGLSITRAKPDPEVFLTAAEGLCVNPGNCVVVEDARAGVAAAKNGGMHCIGIGKEEVLKGADLILKHTGLLLEADYKSFF